MLLSKKWFGLVGLIFLLACTNDPSPLDATADPGQDAPANDFLDVSGDAEDVSQDPQQDPIQDTPSDVPDPFDDNLQVDLINDETTTDDLSQPDETSDPEPEAFTLLDFNKVGNVRGIWADPEGPIWVVGDDGLILRSKGHEFLPGPMPPFETDLTGISGADGVIFVCGPKGAAWRLDGSGWHDLQAPTDADLMAVGAASSNSVYFVGRLGKILHFHDGEWSEPTTIMDSDLHGVLAAPNGEVFAVGALGRVVQFDGTDWKYSQIAAPGVILRSIARGPNGTMVAVGSKGNILMNEGTSWRLQLTTETHQPPRDLFGVATVDGTEFVVVGSDGAVFQYENKKWKVVPVVGPFNTNGNFRAVTANSQGEFIAVGMDSVAIARDDKGSWKDLPLGIVSDLFGVEAASHGGFIAVGESGTVLEYQNGRLGSIEVPTDENLLAISGKYAVGNKGTLLDLSQTPVAVIPTDTTANLVDVWALESKAYVISEDGALYGLENGQLSVITQRPNILSTVCATEETVWIGGLDGRLEEQDRYGQRLLPTHGAFQLHACHPYDGGVLVVGDNGYVAHCKSGECVRLFEDPLTFIYGVHSHQDFAVMVGWAGLILTKTVDGPVTPLDTGVYPVFRDVVASKTLDGIWYLVGLDGTIGVWDADL